MKESNPNNLQSTAFTTILQPLAANVLSNTWQFNGNFLSQPMLLTCPLNFVHVVVQCFDAVGWATGRASGL